MTADAKAFGALQFESGDALDELIERLDDPESDEAMVEVRDAVRAGTKRQGQSLILMIDWHFSNDGNMWFQDWLEDVATAASSGHLDTWQEGYGSELFVRFHAGGEEEQITSPFPSEHSTSEHSTDDA